MQDDKAGQEEALREVLALWNIPMKRRRPDLPLAGSPERTLFRAVVEDDAGGLWVVERPPTESRALKQKIADTLALLHERGLQTVHPYRPSRQGKTIEQVEGDCWQVVPYVGGTALPRPEYAEDDWRGKQCARFLLDLRDRAADVPFFDRGEPFSLAAFVRDLGEKLALHEPDVHRALAPVMEELDKGFFPAQGGLPVTFCHGDFHPVNVIWGPDRVRSVIDWEFLGTKPETYDAANLIGCVGMEEPAFLVRGFVLPFVAELREGEAFAAESWSTLVDGVAASRFAWLSDWLSRQDREMVQMETAYIQLLMNHRKALRTRWAL